MRIGYLLHRLSGSFGAVIRSRFWRFRLCRWDSWMQEKRFTFILLEGKTSGFPLKESRFETNLTERRGGRISRAKPAKERKVTFLTSFSKASLDGCANRMSKSSTRFITCYPKCILFDKVDRAKRCWQTRHIFAVKQKCLERRNSMILPLNWGVGFS